MSVDGLERGQQAFAGLAVEALDTLPQSLDGFHEIVAFGSQRGVLGFDLVQLFFRAQIDRAQPLAVATQLFEIFLDSLSGGNSDSGLISARPAARMRLEFQHVVNFTLESVRRRLAPSMRSSARAVASRALDNASSEILAARSVSAIAISAAASASAATRRAFSADSISLIRARRFRQKCRRILEFGALGLDLGDAGFDGRDLRGRALLAALPLAALGGDRLQAAVRQFGLARQRLGFGPHLCGEAAKAVDIGANRGEPGFGVEARRQFGERRVRALMRALGLAAVGGETAWARSAPTSARHGG